MRSSPPRPWACSGRRSDSLDEDGESAAGAMSEAEKPHHSGHRERLRERALAGGLGALPDYELLELYLFRSIPMRDVKPLAKSLLVRFGDLGGVLGASIAELRSVAGVGESVALDLKLLHEAAVRLGREAGAQ